MAQATMYGDLPERAVIEKTMHGVVQIVALQRALFGNMSPAWTGSGTIVHPSGIVLTNCHVANPRAMGMPAPAANALAVAVTGRSDEPPALTYLAEIVAYSPELDLAVLRLASTLDGKAVRNLKLPYVPIGDSDTLELADTLAIFGYPGIGGETVTFTSGSVSGFSREQGVSDHRAWIKTDATIAGGNSGGTAINKLGNLVGVPTQAAAGSGITPVDARPVVDTNRDGRIDERDTPMAIGGFINGLRPVNLAKPLLAKAGVDTTSRPAAPASPSGRAAKPSSAVAPKPSAPAPARPAPAKPAPVKPAPAKPAAKGPAFNNLVFSLKVTQDGRPVAPAAVLPGGAKQLFASFDFSGMKNGMDWSMVWAYDGKPIVNQSAKWEDGASGRKALVLANQRGLPDGEYHLVITVAQAIVAEGRVTAGKRVDDTDSEIAGTVVDAGSGQGIAGALVIALKPGVKVQDFIRAQDKAMAFTSARTGQDGSFTFPLQLPKGQAYGLVVVARGYQDMAIESALRVSASAPERAQINPIPMQRG